MARADFDAGIAEDLAPINEAVREALDRAGVTAGASSATGGSSLVPAVRARLAATFGPDRLPGGDELTSIAWGLPPSPADR